MSDLEERARRILAGPMITYEGKQYEITSWKIEEMPMLVGKGFSHRKEEIIFLTVDHQDLLGRSLCLCMRLKDFVAEYSKKSRRRADDLKVNSSECQNCGKAFLTGHGTGRRNSSMYCSNACRVMAHRKRKAKEEEKGTWTQ